MEFWWRATSASIKRRDLEPVVSVVRQRRVVCSNRLSLASRKGQNMYQGMYTQKDSK